MKEDFLHYVWQYKKFDFSNLKTSTGDSLTIINSGQYLQLSGPDFFNAKIKIGIRTFKLGYMCAFGFDLFDSNLSKCT